MSFTREKVLNLLEVVRNPGMARSKLEFHEAYERAYHAKRDIIKLGAEARAIIEEIAAAEGHRYHRAALSVLNEWENRG